MTYKTLAFGFTILFKYISCQPGDPQSNGHIPDAEPVFTSRRIYAVYRRPGVEVSDAYGVIPPEDQQEKNRIASLAAENDEAIGGMSGVYDLFVTANPQRTTVNGFLCRQGADRILLQKTGDSAYTKIRFDRYLRVDDLIALEQAAQAQQGDDE